LSRGAAEAVFIEKDPEAVAALRKNVASLGERAHAEIVPGDATRPPRARLEHGVAFIDPPYGSGLAAPALEALDGAGWFAPDALAIVELGAHEGFVPPAGFTFLDERVYGAARLVFLRRDATLGSKPDTPRIGASR
jgi:16S rRNA (guanine966-N2)-methyltransferase